MAWSNDVDAAKCASIFSLGEVSHFVSSFRELGELLVPFG
jgi:hypothetical protein